MLIVHTIGLSGVAEQDPQHLPDDGFGRVQGEVIGSVELGLAGRAEQDPQHLPDDGFGRVRGAVLAGDGQGPEIQEPDPVVQVPELLLQHVQEPGPELVPELRVAASAFVHHVRTAQEHLGVGVRLQELCHHPLG